MTASQNQRQLRDTAAMEWADLESGPVQAKALTPNGEADTRFTGLIRIPAGAAWQPGDLGQADWSTEAYCLSGAAHSGDVELKKGDYLRLAPKPHTSIQSEAGCTLFVRRGQHQDPEALHVASSNDPWLPGQGNLRVKPLYQFGTEGAALVHWPEGERFLQHKHWGGEEILVLSGAFEDEHGRYPMGTWLRSPHMSEHHPFVREETVILVKTGHLPVTM